MSPEAPTVYCPKDKKEVPIWYCLGSFTQKKILCPHLTRVTIYRGKSAEVECSWKKCEGCPLYKVLNPTHIVEGKPYKACSAGETLETCKEDTSVRKA